MLLTCDLPGSFNGRFRRAGEEREGDARGEGGTDEEGTGGDAQSQPRRRRLVASEDDDEGEEPTISGVEEVRKGGPPYYSPWRRPALTQ